MTSTKEQSRDKVRERLRRIGLDFIIGILLILVLLLMKWGLEMSPPGKFLDVMMWCWIQSRFAVDQDRLPVLVVDISNLDSDPVPGHLTPRAQLIKVLDAVMKQGPAAVGIDVDFAYDPKDRGWPPRGGAQFFEYILKHEELDYKAPVFLGVSRTREGTPEEWLGNNTYAELAVNALKPRNDYRKMPVWIRRGPGSCSHLAAVLIEVPPESESNKSTAAGDKATCLPSMSLALARKYPGIESLGVPRPHQLFRAIEEVPGDEAKSLYVAHMPTNYSAVNYFEGLTSTAAVTDTDVILVLNHNVPSFKGKIVLLGNASRYKNDPDKFPMLLSPEPWQPRDVPGVYLHASAIYTLIKSPLFEVTERGRIFLDVFFAGIVLLVVSLLRLFYCIKMRIEVASHRIYWLFTSIASLAVITIGYVTVQYHRILWTDWLLVVFALILHARYGPYVESWLFVNTPALWRRLIYVSPVERE